MATRSRGRRGQASAPAAAPGASTRNARNGGEEGEEMVVEDTQDQLMQEAGETLARGPPPRRSAPFAPSEASIPTRPEGGSDLDGEVNETEAEGDYRDEETDETKLAVMADGLPDANRLSEELWTRLKNPKYESNQYRGILNLKRKQFRTIREEYEDASIAPFVNTRRLHLLDELTGGQGAAFTILRKMNLASALDIIDRMLRGEDTNRLEFFQSLGNGVYPFLLNGDPNNKFAPETVLDIYTHLFIEKLAADTTSRSSFAILAEVFCTSSQETDDFAELLSAGPYVSLGGKPVDGRNPENEDAMVYDRIREISPITKKKGRVNNLREKYDLEKFLQELREFVLQSWPTDPEVFYDAAELNLGGTPMSFDAHASQQLHGSAPARTHQDIHRLEQVSPTARRQTIDPAMEHTRYPSPDNGLAQSEASRAAAQSLAELGEHPLSSVAESEEDAFQTDSRALAALTKRPAPPTSGQQRVFKRQRINDAALPPSSMPPPSTAPPQYATQLSATPDFEAIKAKKRALSAAARAERGEQPTQQRKPWSAADCTTLLNCIFERHASWSQIQAEDSHRFEVPRNQQAYRDKARNMKVDYLITDAVLPPCFDLVALGSKEKARLIAMGKNPNRREGDLDDEGNPINLSYISPEQQQLAESLSQTQQEVPQQAPEPQMA
ncbi:hypothetical protein NLU13_0417 [Sarocladium strictum]|uniref:Myb-like domain-containing protein n=1 Tax=Sarocladium strictum TaxID=5046 RepID=A0AA39GPT1_SARSR|nr:hypothetical protein NLU13_0417 [Sarocladium strictum]